MTADSYIVITAVVGASSNSSKSLSPWLRTRQFARVPRGPPEISVYSANMRAVLAVAGDVYPAHLVTKTLH